MKAKINQINFGYEIHGKKGVPLVLIHGFGLNRKIWLPMVAKYLKNQLVILPDLRGHGESDAPDGPYPMSLLAEDIVNLIEFLEIEKAILCGHSMGGYITLAYADQYPRRMSGMGLITTRAEADTEAGRAGRYEMMEAVKKKGAEPLADSLGPLLTGDKNLVQEMRTMLAETSPAGIIGALEGMAARPDRTDLLPEINVPALVVAGAKDQIIDLESAKQMVDAMPDGAFLSIPDAGHLPMLETAEALGEGLLALVRRVEAYEGEAL
jgi:pimeloyl-ACP methyl ester carboxylesterase